MPWRGSFASISGAVEQIGGRVGEAHHGERRTMTVTADGPLPRHPLDGRVRPPAERIGATASSSASRRWARSEVVQSSSPSSNADPGVRVRVQQIPSSAAPEKLLTAYVGGAMPDVLRPPDVAPRAASRSAPCAASPDRGRRRPVRRHRQQPTGSTAASRRRPGTSTLACCSIGPNRLRMTGWGQLATADERLGQALAASALAERSGARSAPRQWRTRSAYLQRGAWPAAQQRRSGPFSVRTPFRSGLHVLLPAFPQRRLAPQGQSRNIYKLCQSILSASFVTGP